MGLYIGSKNPLRFPLRQTSCRETVISSIPQTAFSTSHLNMNIRHTMPTLALNEIYCLHFGDETYPSGKAGSVYAADLAAGENG